MKLQYLLEDDVFEPRRFLLHLQQLLADEYPPADIELGSDHAEHFMLTIKYADIEPVVFELYKTSKLSRLNDVVSSREWLSELTCKHSRLHPAYVERNMTPVTAFNTICIALRGEFDSIVFSNLNNTVTTELIPADIEAWIGKELDVLFKYLATGRLKRAADVHIVVDKVLDDEGLQKLEARYNSRFINSKKLRVSSASVPNPSDYRARLREIYILADLE